MRAITANKAVGHWHTVADLLLNDRDFRTNPN